MLQVTGGKLPCTVVFPVKTQIVGTDAEKFNTSSQPQFRFEKSKIVKHKLL